MRSRRVFSSAPDFWHLAQGSHDFGKQKLQDIGGENSPCLWLVAAFPIPSAPARPLTSHLPLLRTQLTCTFHAFLSLQQLSSIIPYFISTIISHYLSTRHWTRHNERRDYDTIDDSSTSANDSALFGCVEFCNKHRPRHNPISTTQ